ncbi:hypothetical protein E2493_16055 [Sphingomonas parva]|uniref:Nucleotidyltransferase family protein n=1 Tax=Sphingomonas parva TaxID=2555898 RepID=A0A4Y8ZMK0_9SPHN|nr:nucleotidyltransferase family protein [Sphingomonas parva]TFI57221.1 hypothetical protein E2493_16055 [Sphingomonas parva]
MGMFEPERRDARGRAKIGKLAGDAIDRQAPAEFRLLIACCRWPLLPAQVASLASAASIDWPLFVRMAQRHRVEALARRALEKAAVEIPSEAAEPLDTASSRIAAENLIIAAETARLVAALTEADIPFLFVKGLSLGALAYGTILVKAGWDIDLLVAPEALEPAADLLQRLGYHLAVPPGDAAPARLHAWHARSKESVWRNPGRRATVELHTALTDQAALLPTLDVDAPRQMVAITPTLAVPTLARDELFAYLTVHGASSAWFRLKWLADVAALLAGEDEAEVERLYRRARTLGAGRAAAVALLLCRDLFGTCAGPRLIAELRTDRVNRWMARGAWQSLAGRSIATEVTRLRGGTLWIHLLQFGLVPGLRYKLGELRRQLRTLRPFPEPPRA